MTEIVQFLSIQNSLPLFSSQEIIQNINDLFNKSDLGKMNLSIPWSKLKRYIKPLLHKKGPKPLVPIEGQITIMILKSYTTLTLVSYKN